MSSDIQSILDEISGKMSALDGVVSYPWDVPRVATTPAVLVGIPERVQYRTAYSRKGKKLTVTLVVLVAKANDRAANKRLNEFIDNAGVRSVFRNVDSEFTAYTTCDDVTVVESEPDIFVNAGTSYLGAEFQIDVTATGV